MHRSIPFLTVLLIMCLLFSGCSLAYRVLLGIDTTPDWRSDREIIKQSKKYNIPEQYNFVLDTAAYFDGLQAIYIDMKAQMNVTEEDSSAYFTLRKVYHDDLQPVHFRLFDESGAEIFKIVNCYIDPPIPLNWNVDGCFDTFPPKTNKESLNQHHFDLDFLLPRITLMGEGQSKPTIDELPQASYYGVILWNEYFKRPSRKLIKTVRKNIKKADETVVLLYVNNHNAYLWQRSDAKTKEEIKAWYNKRQESL